MLVNNINTMEKKHLKDNTLILNKKTTMNQIKYSTKMITGTVNTKSLDDLIEYIEDKFDEEDKEGRSLYEFFNLTEQEFKPFFDFDLKLDKKERGKYDTEQYKNDILKELNMIFKTQDNKWAIDKDHRLTGKKKDRIYKVSYHFILTDKKTNSKDFYPFVKKLNLYFKEKKIQFDTSVYRNGMGKFRMSKCKKEGDKNSVLIPVTFADELDKHLIQCIEDCEFLEITDEMKMVINNNIDKDSNIKDIVSGYEVISRKKTTTCEYLNLSQETECPFAKRVHTHNHVYLIKNEDSLMIKCRSDECKNKVKVLFKNMNTDTIEFDLEVFNSFQIKPETKSNYEDKKHYFEKYYKYFRDTDTFYRIQMNFNNRYKYYERELVEIKKSGLCDLKFQREVLDVKTGKTEIQSKGFVISYSFDNKRTTYFNLKFDPSQRSKKYFNLFDGFNYNKVLNNDDEIDESDIEDFDFFLNFIKINVCENKDSFFDYFMAHLANIIQQPEFVTHIVMLYYSSKQGTGKSNFLKFFSKVIGENYSYFGSMQQIFGNSHTTAHLGKFINIIEEINYFKSAKFIEDIKDYSQREKASYNPKGKTEMMIDTFVRYFLTSNNSNAIKIDPDDRRNVVFEFQQCKDQEQVDKMDRIYNSKKMIYMFGNYLKDYDLRKFKNRSDWIKLKPITNAYKLMVYNDSVSQFLKDLYNKGDFFVNCQQNIRRSLFKITKSKTMITNVIKLSGSHLYKYYNDYCKENNIKPQNKPNFMKTLSSNYKFIKNGRENKKRILKIDLEELNKKLEIEDIFTNNYEETSEAETCDIDTQSDDDVDEEEFRR